MGCNLLFRSQDRLEILRYLYFTISRLPREPFSLNNELDYQNERHTMHWFGRLYNIVFQGLLSHDEELKSKAGVLFGSLSTYFEIDFEFVKTMQAMFHSQLMLLILLLLFQHI